MQERLLPIHKESVGNLVMELSEVGGRDIRSFGNNDRVWSTDHFQKDKGSDHSDDFGTEHLIEPTQILARKAQFNARVVIPPVGWKLQYKLII